MVSMAGTRVPAPACRACLQPARGDGDGPSQGGCRGGRGGRGGWQVVWCEGSDKTWGRALALDCINAGSWLGCWVRSFACYRYRPTPASLDSRDVGVPRVAALQRREATGISSSSSSSSSNTAASRRRGHQVIHSGSLGRQSLLPSHVRLPLP